MSKLRSWAPVFVKRIVWNLKHQNAGIDPAGCPHELLDQLRTLEPNSRILDLGCGPGNLRAALRARGWKGHYIGVDVSSQVIENIAKKATDSNAEWHVSDLETFPVLNYRFNVICFCESIYYVKSSSVRALLGRCRQSLLPGGSIMIRIWHADRHREYLTLLEGLDLIEPPLYIMNAE